MLLTIWENILSGLIIHHLPILYWPLLVAKNKTRKSGYWHQIVLNFLFLRAELDAVLVEAEELLSNALSSQQEGLVREQALMAWMLVSMHYPFIMDLMSNFTVTQHILS